MHDPKRRRSVQDFIDGNGDRPISDIYPVLDTDLARDNIENDFPAVDFEDL